MPQPAYALKLAMALGTVRPDIAVALAREAMRSAPDYCEARAIVAALELGSRRQEARRELEAAGKSSNPLCAAAAAAALHDAASTASALASISGNRAALRAWIRQVGGESMSETLSARRYPWGEMTTDAGVVEAMKQLDQALAEVRSSVTEELRGLPRD
jgi:hypothetical protein